MKNRYSTTANRPRSGLDSGLDVIEVLAAARSEMSLTDLAASVGMSKSGVHSVVATLLRRGFLIKSTDGGYSLGIKAWEIGNAAPGLDLAQVARPHMARLAAGISEGAILGKLDGADVVYLQLEESPQAVRVHASIGDRIPAHCTSTGLALLASKSNDEVRALLPARLKAVTLATITNKEQLLRELDQIRLRGYSINRGGWRLDVCGASVCIRDRTGQAIAAICIAVPSYRMTKAWLARVVPALSETAAAIGESMRPDRSPSLSFSLRRA